jgi:hypothetical protein
LTVKPQTFDALSLACRIGADALRRAYGPKGVIGILKCLRDFIVRKLFEAEIV